MLQASCAQIFCGSVWAGRPTPGSALMNLRYSSNSAPLGSHGEAEHSSAADSVLAGMASTQVGASVVSPPGWAMSSTCLSVCGSGSAPRNRHPVKTYTSHNFMFQLRSWLLPFGYHTGFSIAASTNRGNKCPQRCGWRLP